MSENINQIQPLTQEPTPISNPNTENIYNQYSNFPSKNSEKITNIHPLNDASNSNNLEKNKRHRRGKNEISDRTYQCPDCEKCYLSGPALTTHRKTKHGYGTNGEKKSRGRPKKDCNSENNTTTMNAQIKFNNFFNVDIRKPLTTDMEINNKTISLDIIKENISNIFKQCKNELFKNIENVEKYSFYDLVIKNWEKENPEIQQESFSATTKNDVASIKVNNPNLDGLLFLYLKETAKNTNTTYFWFIVKFIVLFREAVNKLRGNMVKKEDKTEKNIVYSQIYNAETVPEICNDFFVEFMDKYRFFGLNQMELIELVQHFCYWLYSKQYTQAHLTLLEN